jgi:hypothetical protein
MSIEEEREARARFLAEPIDPIIVWPGGSPRLAPMIAEMQRLNPSLGLRCATSTSPAREERYYVDGGEQVETRIVGPFMSEYLLYAGTDLHVLTIAMPEPPDDDMMSGFNEVNREWCHPDTDLGNFRSGPRRIERTANGSLLIRPRSTAMEALFGRFGWAYQEGDAPVGEIIRMKSRWGIYHDPHELWEIDFAYLPQWVFNRGLDGKHLPNDPREPKNDFEFWRTIPIGTVSYIDRYDLPLETHFARAREIVAMGAEFAVVGDVETSELHIFRMSGVVRTFDDVRIPELHWFDVPAKSRWNE